MQARPTASWLLPVALAAGVLGIAITAAVLLSQKARPALDPAAISERIRPERIEPARIGAQSIGLNAETDGDALELQWDRQSHPILNADHAIVHIQDGKYHSQLVLTSRELITAKVRYWPESKEVTFRLEVYQGTATVSSTLHVAVSAPSHGPIERVTARSLTDHSVVATVRPSPSVRPRPLILRSPARRAASNVPVAGGLQSPRHPHREPAGHVAQDRPSGFSRVVSKIPLLRRLKKHP